MEKEIWKAVKGYEGCYEVSNLGYVKSLNYCRSGTEGILANRYCTKGYAQVELSLNKKKKNIRVHQLVAESFLNHKRCGNKLVVNHINHDRKDNRVVNLEIITQSSNLLKRQPFICGVSKNLNNKKWRCNIVLNGKKTKLGHFDTELQAINAYQSALIML